MLEYVLTFVGLSLLGYLFALPIIILIFVFINNHIVKEDNQK